MKIVAVVLAGVIATATAATTEGIQAEMAMSSGNTTSNNQATQNQERERICDQPAGAASRWYRIHRGDGPHDCHVPPLDSEWSMLKSYRDGGIQGVHWKFTDNENDKECMNGWNYHAADGRTVKTYVAGRTTTYGGGGPRESGQPSTQGRSEQ